MATRRRPPDRVKHPLPKGIRDVLDKDGYLVGYQLRVAGMPSRNVKLDEGLERAVEVIADMRRAKKNGLFTNEFDERMTVLEFCRFYLRYLEDDGDRARTLRGVASMIKTTIEPHDIGGLRLNRVRSPQVKGWVKWVERERGLQLSTLHARRDRLAAIYNLAIELEFPNLARNPVHAVRLDPVPRRKVINLSVSQVLRLAEAMRYSRRGIRGGGIRMQEEPNLYALVIVMAGLGVRVSEALGLRAGDLRDWMTDEPWVSMESQLAPGALRDDIKTGETGHRPIPVDDLVKDALAALMATPGHAPLRSDDPALDGLIFHRRYRGVRGPYAGNPLSGLRAAVERLHADDPTFPLLPSGTKTHILRYHYGGEMLRRTGGDFAAVARAMGHADTSMLIDTYLKTTPEWQDRIRRASQARWDSAAVDEGQNRSAAGSAAVTPIGLPLDSAGRKRSQKRR
jgi:integrase